MARMVTSTQRQRLGVASDRPVAQNIVWQKSSFSGGGDGANCVEVGMAQNLAWQKSSLSGGGDGPNCVEVRAANGAMRLRESDAPTQALSTTPESLAALIRHIQTKRR
ncbi:hypothetical protein GCM10010277_50840 [Streptomyces longisporoflavus]|uniref:DUF397 domain-containing protein n=1 Tax=Streptomyces longisporoflavus TaxID=28044 RepID=UPI00167E057A|nr:DUF397 domain-containing protein [Streptomyces longisporoflavus]GGV53271.1 hypothetical protein GCM10010277_50840 [Streptomyces longisporoflavus]